MDNPYPESIPLPPLVLPPHPISLEKSNFGHAYGNARACGTVDSFWRTVALFLSQVHNSYPTAPASNATDFLAMLKLHVETFTPGLEEDHWEVLQAEGYSWAAQCLLHLCLL